MLPRDSAECQLAALVLVLSVAMSTATPGLGLQLEARSTNTRSQQECFPVLWDPYQHSSWVPNLNDQIPEYTMWQQFCIINSTAHFTANFNPQNWSRQPYKLSYSEGRYHYNKTLHPYVTEDGRVCVNASITMYDLQGEIDYGDYTIIISTNCSSSNITFQLAIDQCGIGDVPRPIQPTQKPLIVPEVSGQSALSWKYMFYGDNQLTDYVFRITKSGEIVCDESIPGCHFNCTRDTLGQCNITITVYIQNYTHKDSGEYCAAAYPTGAPNPGNDSCLKLVVVQQPVVDQFPGKSKLGLGGASLVYHISNFSEYVNIQFVKDGRKIIDRSGDGYKLELQYNPLDNTTVTLTLHMTGNLKHAGEYTLCTSLVNDTSTPNCTTSVSVSNGLWIGEVAVIVFAFLVVVCCYLICFVKKCNPVTWFNKLFSKSKTSRLNEPTAELDSGNDDDDVEKDSVGTKVQGDAVRELLNKIDIAAQWAPFAQQIGVSRPTVEQIHAENGHSITERKEISDPGTCTSAKTSPERGRDDSTPDVALFCTILKFLRVCTSSYHHERNEYAPLEDKSDSTEEESASTEDAILNSRPGSADSGPAAFSKNPQHQAVEVEVHGGVTDETTHLLAATTVRSRYNTTQSASTNTELPPVWQQIPDDSLPLNERQLQKISEQLTDWKPLARYLGLDEPTIAEIDEDNRTSKERKYQVLYTWSQRKGDNATLKALLQCVEFELGDRELAQRIVYTL